MPIFFTAFFTAIFGVHFYYFYNSLGRFFSPHWTTDDALQQAFPFHTVYHPELFSGDIIYTTMKGYLAPLHYWIGYLITWLNGGDVIMTCHWITFLQLGLTSIFLFLVVFRYGGFIPAIVSITWFFHSRPIVQRLSGGLPRGWSAPIFAIFFYFVLQRNHIAVLTLIFIGILLHPPGAFLIGVSYSLFLLWDLTLLERREESKRAIIKLLLVSPIYLVLILSVIHRPEEVGQMVSFDVASTMPEFQRPFGRFDFLPFDSIQLELADYAFQVFGGRLQEPGQVWRWVTWITVPSLILFFSIFGRIQKREILPKQLIAFLIAAFGIYLASRVLAFKLYVPNRHLQLPMAFFSLVAFPIGVWRLFAGNKRVIPNIKFVKASLAICCLILFVVRGTGFGFIGDANYNTPIGNRGALWEWMQQNIPETALIAGHPTHIDAVQLLGKRKGYATTETAHPFYVEYFNLIKRRLEISIRAHYATQLNDFRELLKDTGADYFVFRKKDFIEGSFKSLSYFSPLDKVLKLVTTHPEKESLFYKFINDPKFSGVIVYQDEMSLVINLKELWQLM